MIRHRLTLVSGALLGLLLFCDAPSIEAQGREQHLDAGPAAPLSQILGRPTDRAITLSVLSQESAEAYVEWGTRPGDYVQKTAAISLQAGVPTEFEIKGLQPNTRYFYRLYTRSRSQEVFRPEAECSFHTQRPPGSAFTFALQGDSHPERHGKMYDPGLYVQTMRNVAKDQPEFYLTLGDDFSIERLIDRQMLSQDQVDQVYDSVSDSYTLHPRGRPKENPQATGSQR